MYIELIDLLRCPRDHEESWLVAAFAKMDGRFVTEGRLGCHVCSASYSISQGVADLRSVRDSDADRRPNAEARVPAEEDGMRTAAMLNLGRPGLLIVLEGNEARLSHIISELTEARVIALNPNGQAGETERVAPVLAENRFPLASASVDGIALSTNAARELLADASRVLKPGGRLVVPAGSRIASSFRELARDESQLVAEMTGPLITLSR